MFLHFVQNTCTVYTLMASLSVIYLFIHIFIHLLGASPIRLSLCSALKPVPLGPPIASSGKASYSLKGRYHAKSLQNN